MAPKKKLDLGSDVDFSWIDNMGLSDEAREKLENALAENVVPKVKNLQTGMTQAQQKASEIETSLGTAQAARKAAEDYSARWNAWARDHKPYVDNWGEVVGAVQRFGGINEMVSASTNGGRRSAARPMEESQRTAVDTLVQKFSAGEMPYEEMQAGIRELMSVIKQQDSRIEDLSGQLSRTIPEERKRYAEMVGGVQHSLTSAQTNLQQNLVNRDTFLLKAGAYMTKYPERDTEPIYKAAVERGLDFDTAAKQVYGQQDTDAYIEGEVAKRLAVEVENEKQRMANLHEESGGGGLDAAPALIFRRNRQKAEDKVPTNPADVNQGVWNALNRPDAA